MINHISMNNVAFKGTRKTIIQGKTTTPKPTDVKTDLEALQSLNNITQEQIAVPNINLSYQVNTYKTVITLKDGREVKLLSTRCDKPNKNKPGRIKKQKANRTIEIKTKSTENNIETEVHHIIDRPSPKIEAFFNNVFRKLVKLNQAFMLNP